MNVTPIAPHLGLALLAVTSLIPAVPAAAQRPDWIPERFGRPAIYGHVIDSTTGRPVPRLWFRVSGASGIGGTDSLGRYLIGYASAGEREISFLCPAERRWPARRFTTRTITVTLDMDSLIDWRLDLTGCKEPPVTSVAWEGEGFYAWGFETSMFTPCVPPPDLVGTAYQGLRAPFWIDIADDVRMAPGAAFRQQSDGDIRAFVRWRGTLTGPGSYGHLGVGIYELRVEEVFEVRPSGEGRCE